MICIPTDVSPWRVNLTDFLAALPFGKMGSCAGVETTFYLLSDSLYSTMSKYPLRSGELHTI